MPDNKDRDQDQTANEDNGSTGTNHDNTTGSQIAKAGGRRAAQSSGDKVELPAEALHEAVSQLKQLAALRQQETERQERAFGEMQVALQRQGRTNGWLVFLSLVLVAVAGAGVYHFLELQKVTEQQGNQLAQVGQRVNREVSRQTELLTEMDGRVAATRDALQSEVGQQTALLTAMDSRVAETREAVQAEVAKVGGEVQATREVVTQEVGRQAETLTGLQEAVSATRAEQAERLSAVEAELARSLTLAGDEQAAAVAGVREAVELARQEQAERLAGVNDELTRSLTEMTSGQTVALMSVNDQVTALREQLAIAQAENAELSQIMDEKIQATEMAIADRVEQSVAAVREERDLVLAEMSRVLEERMAQLDEREVELERRQAALNADEERFAQQAAASRDRMRALLNDAMESLAPAAPAVQAAEPGDTPEPAHEPDVPAGVPAEAASQQGDAVEEVAVSDQAS